MKLTNNYNLSYDELQIINKSIYRPVPDVLRVTELINPPMIKRLMIDHWDDIVIDASEYLWVIFGTDIHHKLEQISRPNVIKELSLSVDLPNHPTIKGTLDLFDLANLSIDDYKTTSVWKSVKQEYNEYAAQLNIYRWLAIRRGLPAAKRLRNILFVKDWSVSKAMQDKDYPQCQRVVVEHKVWSDEVLEKYLLSRLQVHEQTHPKVCSPEERWEKPTIYAVMKEGQKSAVRGGLKTNQSEADEMARTIRGGYVEIRPGGCKRCEAYCPARSVCGFAKKLRES